MVYRLPDSDNALLYRYKSSFLTLYGPIGLLKLQISSMNVAIPNATNKSTFCLLPAEFASLCSRNVLPA